LRHIIFALAFLLGTFTRLAAQETTTEQKFLIAVDTIGVTAVAPDVYTTWIYALTSPTSYPSSGILVAFDCAGQRVKRLAHVVYHAKADGSPGVEGPIEEDLGAEWQEISIPRLFTLVCRIGSTRPYEGVPEPTTPQAPAWDGKTFQS
jgi:hypothetical protein